MAFPDTTSELLPTEAVLPSQPLTWATYRRYWYLFALGLLVALAGAWLYLRYTVPQYSINMTILIKDKKDEPQQRREERFNDPSEAVTSKNIDNEILLLKSTSLMQRVFTNLDMQAAYYVKGRVGKQELYGENLPCRLLISRLDSSAFNKQVLLQVVDGTHFTLSEGEKTPQTYAFGQLLHTPYGEFTVVSTPANLAPFRKHPLLIRFQDRRELASSYAKKLNVSTINKQASLLSLNVTDAVPERGEAVLNKLVEVYNQETVEDKNQLASNTIRFIDDRLKYLESDLTSVEKNVEDFQRKNKVVDVTSQVQQSLQEASGYNKQLADYEIQLEVMNSIEQYINQPTDPNQLIPGTLSVQDPTLSGLITKFNELQLERERMLRTAQADNPVVLTMTDQLTNLRASILENLRSLKSNLTITRRNLQAKSGQFGSRMQQMPTIERGLQEISRQQDLKRDLYLYLLQKREEAALSLAATVSAARVIDAADAGENPVSPQKPAVLAIALMLGLGLPFAFVYVKNMFNDKVQTLQEVAWATGVPVLGELAHNRTREALVISPSTRSPLAEMVRLLRTNLQLATAGSANQVLLVTSSRSGDGKTFVSLNLAASLLLAGKKVVLVNLDLRKPDSLSEAGVTNGLGVSEYLTDETVRVDALVQPSPVVEGLYVIGAGALPENPAELLLSPRVNQMLKVLKESFDHIILDSAPIGQVADAYSVAPYVDATLYVVRYNVTQKAQLQVINKLRSEHTFNQLMVVLNDARPNNLSAYGYGQGYGYPEANKSTKSKKLV
ncbi:GumC family protein [Hymenobacter cavernae]|uniref:Tyrosine protein kinase n=1 Tax=Hymenobacter cavernae TaxID=2044852 RepID=A0ABQ1UHX0_9BACT|nr:tyrosine-protein kinase family protein [Hymenobacter cavernae]GGF17779.1 tyrosine protein kinase [Hymenobacter cavernae]